MTAVPGVSDADRAAVRRQAAALRDVEQRNGSFEGPDEQRQSDIDAADADRRRIGLAPLKTEGEFHRKAAARGFILQ
jgi:hypothetical protein